MKRLSMGAIALVMYVSASSAHAACAMAAIMGAPALPTFSESSIEEVAALRERVNEYIETASKRLESCQAPDAFVYNYAVGRLESYAQQYNGLARQYNQRVAALD